MSLRPAFSPWSREAIASYLNAHGEVEIRDRYDGDMGIYIMRKTATGSVVFGVERYCAFHPLAAGTVEALFPLLPMMTLE